MKYWGDRALKEVLEDEKLFEEMLENVVVAAIERAMIYVPRYLITQIQHAQASKDLVERFYRENRDLKAYKDQVGNAVTRLHAEDPLLSMEELLKKASEEVRKEIKSISGK